MPAGRPPKRPPGDDGLDAPLDSLSSASKTTKLPRIERGPEDFSSVVKNKLQSYTRTGQACDRCKVRKIRCDALPNGCTHCTQQNLDCYVTDRVTGRTERRGYLQQLERENDGLLAHIRDLERLLETKGVTVRPFQQQASNANAPEQQQQQQQQPPSGLYGSSDGISSTKSWEPFGSLWIKDHSNNNNNTGFLSSIKPQTAASAHLGVVRDYAPLSAVEGTQLSILGTTIDITSFDAPDMDGPPVGASRASPIYNKSLQSFYNSITKINPPLEAPMPSREDAFSYSERWFLQVGRFLPVLHKPTYFKLLARIYDDPGFKPSTAELVIVHMVLAMSYYQTAVRNVEASDVERKHLLNDISNKHYHWSVDKTWDIASDLSLNTVSALILIVTHCRSFPKPGPAWLVANLAWTRAIEMDLHRPFLPDATTSATTTLENEMRKRLFWSLLMVVIVLYGRLGKPIPIRAQDFDVELPLLIPDECFGEDGSVTTTGEVESSCYWLVAAQGFKLSYLFLDMWNNVYPVRQDPQKYMANLRRLEGKFRVYQSEIPEILQTQKTAADNNRDGHISWTFLQATGCEFLLCLYHPSRCTSTDPALVADNNRKCDEAAKRLLTLADELRTYRALDTTWYQIAVYVAAMFTLLASGWERRAEIGQAELGELREYMAVGISVVREILNYIGASDSRVLNQITAVIDRTISSIEQDMSLRPSNTSRAASRYQQQQASRSSSKHCEDYTTATTNSRASARPARSNTSTPTPIDHMQLPRIPGINNNPQTSSAYYQQQQHHHTNSPLNQINTAYSQLGYPDLGNSAPPLPPPPYVYASSQQHGGPQPNSPHSSSSTHSPAMVGYGTSSHHHPHPHHHQQQQSPWLTAAAGVPSNGTNPWNEWANTMVVTSAAAAAAVAPTSAGGGGGGSSGGAPGGATHHPQQQQQHQNVAAAAVAAAYSHHHHQQHHHPHHHAAPGQAGGGAWPMIMFHHPVSGP